MKYDVFISYRREGGKEFARSIKSELEHKGYAVFLDFDELTDGVFDERIMDAIRESPVFIFILSQHSLDRCVNEDDWVRREIEYASELGRHIIPVNKDGDFEGLPENLPEALVEVFGRNQYSDIMVGQLFEASMRKMIKERIAPIVRRPSGKQWLRYVVLCSVLLIIIAGIISFNLNSKAHAAADRYDSLLKHAEEIMSVEDSLDLASECIDEACSIFGEYQDSYFKELFGERSTLTQDRFTHVRDSLFRKNRNYADFYITRYREEGNLEDKQMALTYIDRALNIMDDIDLQTMRRILQ